MQTFKWMNINVPPKSSVHGKIFCSGTKSVDSERRTNWCSQSFWTFKQAMTMTYDDQKKKHRSRLDVQAWTRKGCGIMTNNLTKKRSALSHMFLTSGRSQTNAVIQMYIPDVDVKQRVNALSRAALFQLQLLLLTDSLHVCWVQKATISA